MWVSLTAGVRMHIEHINISAPRELLQQVKEFYCNIFNLTEGFRPAFSRNGFWLYADRQAIIHLTESNQHYCHKTPCYLDHIAFQFQGLQQFIQKLRAMDVEFTADSLLDIGMTQIFFKDPAGMGLEANFVNESLANL